MAGFFSQYRSGSRLLLLVVFFALGCSRPQAKSPDERDTLIPEETQQESRERYGEQEIFMDDLSQSTSEQAGARHDRAVRRARDPVQEKGSK